MDSIALIRTNLERSELITLSRVEEMRDHCMVAPTPVGGCHTLWVLGHLAFCERLVTQEIMRGETNPLAHWRDTFDGAEVSQDPEDYPPFDLVLEACRAARRDTITTIDALSEPELDAPSHSIPHGAEELFPTARACLQYVSDHWLMHRGQLADARRAAGLLRMWY